MEITIFNDLEPKLIWMNHLQTLPIHFPVNIKMAGFSQIVYPLNKN